MANGNTNLAIILQSSLQTPESEARQLDEDDNSIVPDGTNICLISELSARFGIIDLCQRMQISNKLDVLEKTSSQAHNVQKAVKTADATIYGDEPCDFPTVSPPLSNHYDQQASFSVDDSLGVPFPPPFPNALSGTLLQQYQYPELTAGVEDWAFQGVDMAFIESLTRVAGDVEHVDQWLTWQS